ncbi:MAG TPA: hypothetical protein DER60_10725 [Syntrophomonas sp.]|jgi:PAS domain S-box-containing protein|nr:hypothetical protein [Syntrophomonas sp.]
MQEIPDYDHPPITGCLKGRSWKMRDKESTNAEKSAIFELIWNNCTEAMAVARMIFDDNGRPVDYTVLDMNYSYEKQSGLSKEQVLGRRATAFLPNIESAWLEKFGEVVRSGRGLKFEEYNTALDRWFNVQAFSLHSENKFVVVFTDITDPLRRERTLKQSEARRREQETLAFQAQILANVKDAVMVVDENGLIIYCNRAFEDLFGWKEDELLGQRFYSFVNSHVDEGAQAAYHYLYDWKIDFETIDEQLVNIKWFRKDGRPIVIDVSRTVLTGPGGEYKGIISSIRDATPRVQAEEALRESERKYRELVQNAPAAICQIDLQQQRFVSVNAVMCKLTGYRRDELLKMAPVDILGEQGREIFQLRARQWLNGEKPEPIVDCSVKTKAGREILASLHVTYTTDQDGKPLGATVIGYDVTERRHVEKELQKAHDHLEAKVQERTRELSLERQRLFDVLETLPVIICILTPDHHVAFANRAFRNKFGESEGRHCYDYIFGLDEPCDFCQAYRVLETGKPHYWRLTAPDGSIIDAYDLPFIDVDGSPLILEIDIDITKQKQAEDAFRASEERFHKIFDNNPDMIAIIRMADDTFVDVNHRLLEITGYEREEVLGKTPEELDFYGDALDEARSYLAELVVTGEIRIPEWKLWSKTGNAIITSVSTVTMNLNDEICRVVIMRDITKEKLMETEIARLDRLNMIGEMAAGIGHEIRNPLTAVRGFLQMLGHRNEYENDRSYFELMIEEIDRANAIISEYLGMARDKRVDLRLHSLDDLITTLYPMIMSEANLREMAVHLELNQPPAALIDQNEFRQLVLNMTRNGLDAMPPRGTLTIGTGTEGDRIVLYIRDEGSGLPPEILHKLGTPFFTTKDTGTGLGLAVCYSIAARHHATIDYQTKSTGTTFYVRFPKV